MTAKHLNETCACRTLDPDLLKSNDVLAKIMQKRPNLFSATSVFISPEQYRALTSIISAIEETINLEGFKKLVLPDPRQGFGPKGVFMGYDFHLSDEGPKLIEINTNAGGALLNLELARAQEQCCQAVDLFVKNRDELPNLQR